MAETADQILEEIEAKRNQLGQNIDELESYVREKADVRAHFEKRPWTFLGAAAFIGLLMAVALVPGSSTPSRDHLAR